MMGSSSKFIMFLYEPIIHYYGATTIEKYHLKSSYDSLDLNLVELYEAKQGVTIKIFAHKAPLNASFFLS